MPGSQDIERGWFHGLSHQEAPQANGQEEAPQVAAEDQGPAQEQEVGALPGRRGKVARPRPRRRYPAVPRGRQDEPASGRSSGRMAAESR